MARQIRKLADGTGEKAREWYQAIFVAQTTPLWAALGGDRSSQLVSTSFGYLPAKRAFPDPTDRSGTF